MPTEHEGEKRLPDPKYPFLCAAHRLLDSPRPEQRAEAGHAECSR